MPARKDDLSDRLSRYHEITISFTGRKSGQIHSNPVWFVFEDGKVNLLPVKGSDTQWYKNILKKPSLKIEARGAEGDFHVTPIHDPKRVSAVVDKFREKYGAGDVKKYYSKFDVAVVAEPQGSAT